MRLASLTLRNETPVFLGSYDTDFHPRWPKDPFKDPFRVQSLKGLWRYWMRAYVAGALYELGLLRPSPSRSMVRELDRDSMSRLLRLVQNLLGGPAGPASRFRIVARVSRLQSGQVPSSHPASRVQRVRLLTMSRRRGRRRYAFADQLEVTLRVEVSPHATLRGGLRDCEILLGIGSLLTALSLNGLGKMGRRGFGTFSVAIREGAREFRRFTDRRGVLDVKVIGKVVDITLRSAIEYVESLHSERGQFRGLPPLSSVSRLRIDPSHYGVKLEKEPIILKKGVPVFSIHLVSIGGKGVMRALEELQDFFYRPGRIRRLYGSPTATTRYGHAQDFLTSNKYCWYLGLPRSQRGTGYISRAERRASPLHLAVHREAALITSLLSTDWPKEIRWKGGGVSRTITLSEAMLVKTHCEVLAYLEEYVGKLGYSYRVVYP